MLRTLLILVAFQMGSIGLAGPQINVEKTTIPDLIGTAGEKLGEAKNRGTGVGFEYEAISTGARFISSKISEWDHKSKKWVSVSAKDFSHKPECSIVFKSGAGYTIDHLEVVPELDFRNEFKFATGFEKKFNRPISFLWFYSEYGTFDHEDKQRAFTEGFVSAKHGNGPMRSEKVLSCDDVQSPTGSLQLMEFSNNKFTLTHIHCKSTNRGIRPRSAKVVKVTLDDTLTHVKSILFEEYEQSVKDGTTLALANPTGFVYCSGPFKKSFFWHGYIR